MGIATSVDAAVIPTEGSTVSSLTVAVLRHQRAFRSSFRTNFGFSPKESERFLSAFNHYDTDQSGDITELELQKLCKDLFPEDQFHGDIVRQTVQAADEDGNGALDFEDFLRLMREMLELKQRHKMEK